MGTNESARVLVEQVVREEVFDVRGVRIRARELIIDHGAYSRGVLELCRLESDVPTADTCLVDLRRAGEAE